MKKTLLLLSTFSVLIQLNAQNVGINTTGAVPDGGAALDVNYDDKGLLIPRVDIIDLTTIAPITGSSTVSMLVYNTNIASGVGYHYWDGTQWVRLAVGGDYWDLEGNAGTDGGTNNFLGTTDAQNLNFRTNNIDRIRIMSNNLSTTRVGVGTIFPTSYPPAAGNTPTLLHVFDGGNALTDFAQIQLGAQKSTANSKVGEINFQSVVNGPDRRTAAIESHVTAIPTPNNQSGDLRFSTNENGVFTEKMRLEPEGNLGINTTDPTEELDVNGQVRIRGGAPAVGRVLTSDANGVGTWEDLPPSTSGGIDWTQTVWVQNSNYTVPAGVEIVHFWDMSQNRNLILGTCSAGTNNGRQIIAVNHGGRDETTSAFTDYNISLTTGNTNRFPGLNTYGSAASGGYNVKTFVCMNVPTVGYRWTWR